MAAVQRIVGDVVIDGGLQLTGTLTPGLARTNLAQDNLVVYPVPFEHLRVHDALQTVLPGTSATDDLGLYGGTFGTSQPLVRTYDVKTVGATSLYARAMVRLPAEYQAAETVKFRISFGMVTTVADTSCTIDVEAYRVGKANSLGSDICATAATSMNSLTFSDKDFTITAASLSPGDLLDVRFRITCTDAAGATAVIGAIGGIDLLCDVKG
jgi:hypothetical protein